MAGTLGEAYIAIRADMRPFTRNLHDEVEKAAQHIEDRVHASLSNAFGDAATSGGREAGGKFSDEFDKETRRRFNRNDKNRSWFVKITAALASALDDGISALPAHAKAAIVIGIVAALPLVSGALAGAVSAGIGAGIAGLGVLLAFQFDVVRAKATDIFGNLRLFLANLASPFIVETLKGLDRIEQAFQGWAPQLRRIFMYGALFVKPLETGTLGALDKIINKIADVSDELVPFVDELGADFEILGGAIADAIGILVSTGEDGQNAMRDLVKLTADFIVNLALMMKALATIYGWFRKINEVIPFFTSFVGLWFQMSDNAAESTGRYGDSLNELEYDINGTVVATKNQEKATKDAAKAMDEARDAAFGLIDATVDYEESIDRLDEKLKENGKTLDVTGEKGRENIRAFSAAFKAAQEQAEQYYQQGKLNSEQARQFYNDEVAQIEKIAAARGVDITQLHAMYEQQLDLVNLPNPQTDWLIQIGNQASIAASELAKALAAARLLNSAGLPRTGTRIFSEYAEGGIVNGPQAAIIGEAGPEVVIPLTKPGRAAQLAQESGLLSMLGAGGGTEVYVYLGNDQLEPYMIRVTEKNNKALGTAMSYGPRGL
jgi:hypothetical protein